MPSVDSEGGLVKRPCGASHVLMILVVATHVCVAGGLLVDTEDAPDERLWSEVAKQVAIGLREAYAGEQRPTAGCFGRDLHDDGLLASEWPRAEFRDILLSGAANQPTLENVLRVLYLLSDYDDPKVDAFARRFLQDGRACGTDFDPLTVADVARNALEPAPPVAHFRPSRGLLPETWLDDEGRVDVTRVDGHARKMTVPNARKSLQDSSLSIRLQAWLWLAARHGIVVRAEPLRDAWPALSARARAAVLESLRRYDYTFRTDTTSLAQFLGELFKKADEIPSEQSRPLLVLCARLGIPAAKQRAISMIEAASKHAAMQPSTARSPMSSDDRASTLEASFEALGYQVATDDVTRLLAWSQSQDPMVRAGAGYALAAADDWRAVHMVMAHIISPVRGTGMFMLDANLGVHELMPCSESVRWAYIRFAVRVLHACDRDWNPRTASSDGLRVVNLLQSLTGYRGPAGVFGRPGTVARDEFSSLAHWWEQWYEDHCPSGVAP
ncbi:MAG: hypothetical protein D6744_15405 [Planctomycetota bacterium]|nr:MAG: hypothetical protein D6744_15405 [Planctomycetota bacterium]